MKLTDLSGDGKVTQKDKLIGAGVLDKDGNKVTLDDTKVAEARKAIDDAFAATKYQRDRAAEYPSWQDQLDKIYHSGIDAWKADIKVIKDKYPKP